MFKEIDEKNVLLDAKRPLSTNFIDNLKKYFDIGLTYNLNAIEENQLLIRRATPTRPSVIMTEYIVGVEFF